MCLLLFLFFQFSFFHVSGILISVVWDLRLNFLPRVPSWTKVEPHRSQWLCKVFGVVHSSMAARIGQISNAVVWCLSNGLNQPLAKNVNCCKMTEYLYSSIYYRMIWNQYTGNSILLMKKGMQNAHLHRKDVFNTSFNTYIYKYI